MDYITVLISFLIGTFFGLMVFALTYTLFFIRGLKKETPALSVKPVDQKALDDLLKKHLNTMHDDIKIQGFQNGFLKSAEHLIVDVARHYYPDSKNPLMELSIDELLLLDDYIHDRINNLFNKPLFKNVKHIKIIRYVELLDLKRKIDDQQWMKFIKNKNVQRSFKGTLNVVNAFNPVYWFRKALIKTSVEVLNKQIAKTLLAVVAEETSQIYSKQAFNKRIDYDLVEKEIKALETKINDEDD
jgi:hypothetical protein